MVRRNTDEGLSDQAREIEALRTEQPAYEEMRGEIEELERRPARGGNGDGDNLGMFG